MAEKPSKKSVNTQNRAYSAFDSSNKVSVVADHSNALTAFGSIQHEKATATQLTSDLTVRFPFSRDDYDYFRPNEKMPRRFRDVVTACRASYLRVGVVRNVIDMMTDFATEDLRIIHPDKKVEAFFRVWIKKVKLLDAVDEFVRHFLIDGNVVVKRTTAKLTKPVESQWMERAVAADDPTKLYTENVTSKREIPWKYSFLNITALNWVGDDLAQSSGGKKLVFKVSPDMMTKIKTAKDPFSQNIINKLPSDVVDSIRQDGSVAVDMDTVYVTHNKKDSWEDWAPPFLYSVLSEIYFRDKLRQAEISALDGMINVIRLWKLGDHTEGILPNQTAVDKLIGILEANTGGGAMDIVWDSMISMEEFYPPVEKILGSEKYDQVNRDILIGLGVPEVLIGGRGGNFSNSYIQLKTMVEKLEFVRSKVAEWLQEEINIVCEAMDIKGYPKVKFNAMSLEDESTARKLIVELLDRGIISVEAVLEAYGEDFLIEVERMKGEKPLLKNAGIEVKSPLDQTEPVVPGGKKPTKTGRKGSGRPPGSKDTSRKVRTPKLRTKASIDLTVFALDAIDAIEEYVIPVYMNSLNISNARKLNSDQKEELNNIRVAVLACIKPTDALTEERLLEIAENSDSASVEIIKTIAEAISDFTSQKGSTPTLTQRKRIEAVAWSTVYGDKDGEI